MKDLFYFIVIVCTAYGIGRVFLSLFIKNIDDLLDDLIFSTGTGLALLGYIVYIIGSLGFLYLRYILFSFLICALIAILPVYRFIRTFPWGETFESIIRLGRFDKFLLLVLISLPLICLFGAMAPPIGNDALAYHLYHPKVFIQNHNIGYIPFTRESLWPYLTEMLYTLGLILKGAAVAKMFHLLFGILTACAVFSFTKNFFSRKEAFFAAAFFYSAPGIFMQSPYAYVDLSLCFYSFIAFYALMLWHKKNDIGLIMLSGIFTGLALSVKLLGGITLIALGSIMLYILLVKKLGFKTIVKLFFIFTICVSLVSSVWYIRSYLVLGSPVYPFLSKIFHSGWPTRIGIDLGTRRDLIGFFRLPWDLVVYVDSFGGEQIGLIFLAFLPCIFFVPFKRDVVRSLLLFLVIYAVVWFWVNPNVRFAFVNFAAAFVLIGIGFNRVALKYGISFLKILLCLCIIFNVSLCIYYNRDAIRLRFNMISREEYLFMKERTYPVAEFVNKNLPLDSLIIVAGEPRVFYFDRRTLDYWIWEKMTEDDIVDYVNELKNDRIPVYLLYKEGVHYKEVLAVIRGKTPVYDIARKIEGDETVYYSIFEL